MDDDEAFDEVYEFEDPVPIGRQILAKSGRRPEKNFQLLLLTKDGGWEEIGLEEQVDLREPGVERFFVFETDRLFFLVIDDRRFAWGGRRIKTSTLRFLAGVGDDHTVWLEQRGSQVDEGLDPNGFAELTGNGVEVFFTGKDQTDAGDGLEKLPQADRPFMLELFARKPDLLTLNDESHLTPIPIKAEVSSLSAILLEGEYYQFLQSGKRIVNGIPIIGPEHLIPLKARDTRRHPKY